MGLYAPTADGSLQPLGEPVVASQVAVKDRIQTEPGAIGHTTTANFDGQIELLGYDTARQPSSLRVTLHWRALQPPAKSYTVFVHLLDAGGQIVAQHDSQPQGGACPTSVWDTGEVVTDEHLLDLPATLPPTPHRLPATGDGASVKLRLAEID